MSLHQLLRLERPLIVFDCETTGTNVNEDYIIELGFQIFTSEGMTKEWSSKINPGRPIPKESIEVHHITDEDVRDKPKFSQLAPNIAKGFSDCDFAGKNIRFDLQILSTEMNRTDVIWSYGGAKIICADRLEQIGEPRSLSHLFEKYTGRKMESAHEALPDVRATVEILAGQFRKHQMLPRTLNALHDLQWPGYIDSGGKFRYLKGVPTCMFGKHRFVPLRSIPLGYWVWLLKSDFSSEVKLIAENSLKGIYPEEIKP